MMNPYLLIPFVLLNIINALPTLTSTAADVNQILNSMDERKVTVTNVRLLFKGDHNRMILHDLKTRRSNLAKVPRSEEGKMNEYYKALKSHSDEIQNKTIHRLKELIQTRTIHDLREIIKNEAAKTPSGTRPPFFVQMWIRNQLYVWNADRALIKQLGKMEDVSSLKEDTFLELFSSPDDFERSLDNEDEGWNMKAMGIPTARAQGKKGKGVVVGIIDTGVQRTHEALWDNWRSDHGWFDAYEFSNYPSDFSEDGHGTSVAGIAVGTTKGIGIAPEAKWIACRALGDSTKYGIMATEWCMQWMNCPTDEDGNNLDCSKRPDIVNCSWGHSKGKSVTSLIDAQEIEAWVDNQVIPIFTAGNLGPDCGSIVAPGNHPDVITVGAFFKKDGIWSSSGSGPVVFHDKNIIKPDVVAPGNLINTSRASNTSVNAYALQHGSGIATPHVAGLAALYYSELPLERKVEGFRTRLKKMTKKVKPTGKNCDDRNRSETLYPNNRAGYGLVHIGIAEKGETKTGGSLNQPSVLLVLGMYLRLIKLFLEWF